MILNTIYIAIIFTIVTDVLHFWDEFSPNIKSLMTRGILRSPIKSKIMTCSTCQTHWMCLLYLIITGMLSIKNYCWVIFLSAMTPVVAQTFILMKNILIKTIGIIADKLNI